MSSLVKYVEDNLITKKEFPSFSSGDTITVYYEIKEGSKTRTQFFKGVVLQRKGSGSSETFTIRKNVWFNWSRKNISNQLACLK